MALRDEALDRAHFRRGVAEALQAAAEERDRDEEEIISPATVESVEYHQRDGSVFVRTRDGRIYRISVTEETNR